VDEADRRTSRFQPSVARKAMAPNTIHPAAMNVDVHTHVVSEALLDRWAKAETAERWSDSPESGPVDPGVYEYAERFERMDEMGVDLHLVSPMTSFTTWDGGAADVEFAREINQSTAECVAGSDGRFAGMATLALGEPDKAPGELKRALDEYEFAGAFTGTYGGDRPLDHASLEPLWAELGHLGVPVFMHPMSPEPTPRWDEYTLTTAINWPNETALATSRLIFAGTLERNPGLNLILSHGGGTLPFLRGRLDLAYNAPTYENNPDCRANISKPPSEYLDQLYFDTAVASAESLHFLIDLVGAERVVFGTDDPFEIADTGGKMALPALERRPEAERELVRGGTMTEMLAR
jgi:aminocarboxymuconate-semialdehyde decarboxylase